MPIIDLHFHSNYSDGKLSVAELATIIIKKGLKYCSLTDHDTIAGVDELKKCLNGSDTVVIPGVELTALYGENEIHILAYDFDIKIVDKILKERNKLVKKQKIIEMEKAVSLFKKNGLKITNNLEISEKKPVGYTLATDICKQKINQDIFIKRHGKKLTLDDIYFKYQAPGKICAVDRSGVSVEWLLDKLKDGATDVIIAHPFLQTSVATSPLSENDIFSLLDMGYSGVEIYHDKTSEKRIQWLKKITNEKKLNYTGGSDFHGRKNDVGIGLYGVDLEIPNFKICNYELV
ncbi:MAG: PHP domain-containing protein [Candidatus Falkowbacteria bacterium]